MKTNYSDYVPEYLEGIPHILYKYRQWNECGLKQNQRRILTDNEIFLSSPSRFNDPFDCGTPFKYKKEQLTEENIYLKLRQTAKENNPNANSEEIETFVYNRQKEVDWKSDGYVKDYFPDFIRLLHENFGVFCLTPHNNNILMWSHYSDSHKGFCVGFDSKMLFETISGMIGKVHYTDKFVELDMFTDELGVSRLLYAKHNIWEYEDEYRFTKFEGADKVVKIPNEAIKEVIFGANMPEEIQAEITKMLYDERKLDIIFSQAKPSFDKYELEINELKLF